MKIAFISDAYIPVPTGVAVSMQTLKVSLEKMGHTVYVFAPDYFGFQDNDSHIARLPAIFSIKEKYRPNKWPLVRIKRDQIEKLGIDLVHSHYFFKNFDFAVRLARAAGAPLIASVYQIFPEIAKFKPAFLQSPQSSSESALNEMIGYLNQCQAVVALSAASRQYLIQYPIHSTIETIPIGIFPRDFAGFPPQSVKAKFNIPQERKIVLYVGRVEDDKNLKFLLKSFKLIWKAIDDVHLLIVGGGTKLKYYQEIASLLPYHKFITFTGYLPKSYVNRIYGASDVFAYPSQIDPQPLAVLESIAAGTPVVALKGLGAQDFIAENIDGFVTKNDLGDFSDKVIELLRRDKMRLEFSQNARREAQAFKSSNLTRDLLKFYEQVIEESKNSFYGNH